MQIFYVFYFTLVTYLLATTMPESQGRWLALSRNIVSLISYAHSTTPVSVDTCWPSSFGIDDTCHPLDLFITPTPTVISSTPATRTVSAVAASPIGFNTVSYRDVFAERFDIARAPRNRKNSKPTQRGTLCGVELAHLLDLLTTVTSTMIIVQLFTVLGQLVVRYLESPSPIASIPNDLEFHPPTALLDGRYTLIPSWISTASSLIHADSIAYVHSNDGVSLKELPLWGLYFATILVRSCYKPVVSPPPPPTETRVAHRLPLMIEASTSKAAKVLSICWFQSHTLPGSSSGLGSKVQSLELKDKLNSLPPVLELTPSIQPQAQDAAHLPASSTTNSLHLVVHVDSLGSEITGPNQPGNPASSFLPETRPPTGTELSHQHPPPGVSKPPLVRSFEKISGRRVTPLIQLEYGQVDGVSQVRSSLSFLKVISMDSLLPGEYDLGFLSQFPAPPEKVPVRPHSLPGKLDMRRAPFLRSPPSPSQDSISNSQEVRPMCHLPILTTPGSTASPTSPARKEKRGFSIYYRPVSQRSAQFSPSVVMDPAEPASGPRSETETTSQEGSPVPNIRLSISSASSRWSLFAKKSKLKLKKVSSLFASSNSLSNLHEKVNAFPKTSSRKAFNKSKRLPELPGSPFNGNASKTCDS